MFGFFYTPFGFILQIVAVIHFIRRRPDGYWLWIILIGGWLGSLIYIAMEVIPDLQLLRGAGAGWNRRNRMHELEGMVRANPSAGNYEELGALYYEAGKYAQAREAYDRSIAARSDSIDDFYRRGLSCVALGDFTAAVPDLEHVVNADPDYDFYRAGGVLAHALARSGQEERAAALFEKVTAASTLSETEYNYAELLARQGRHAEARQQLQRLLGKKATMPGFMRRLDRPWFRRGNALLKSLPR